LLRKVEITHFSSQRNINKNKLSCKTNLQE
jgi:hypothetical protein